MPHVRSVLFVCTGNIFRSMTAEYALRRALGASAAIQVSSAGTANRPDLSVRSDVAAYLLSLGLDVSLHQRRTIDTQIIDGSGLIIAMHKDHKRHLADQFGLEVPLFSEATRGEVRDMPDVDDLFAPKDFLSSDAVAHVKSTINLIIEDAPKLADRLMAGR